MTTDHAAIRHSLATRLVHAGLAIAVIIQLSTSLVMHAGRAGDPFFKVHSFSGLTAMVFVTLFWIVAVVRTSGTDPGMLLPWFSQARRRALLQDIKTTLSALGKGRLPPFKEASPLAAMVHGLGLLLMTAMASSGTLYFFLSDTRLGFVEWVIEAHKLLASLVWVYLIAHSFMALLYHSVEEISLSRMWSVTSNRRTPPGRK